MTRACSTTRSRVLRDEGPRRGRARRLRHAAPAAGAIPMSDAVRAALAAVIDGETLDRDRAHRAMGAVMDGESTPAQLAALLVALRMRGETVDELAGFAQAMRERVVRVDAPGGRGRCRAGPAATARAPSTSRRPRRSSSRRPACRSRSTATGRSPRGPARPTCSTRSACGSTTTRTPPRPPCERRLRVPVRARVPPGDAPRGPDPPGDRRPDGVQPAGPARRTRPGRAASSSASGTRSPPRSLPRSCAPWARSDRSSSTAPGVDELPLDGSGVIHDVTPGGVVRREVDVAALGLDAGGDRAARRGSPAENAALVEAVLAGTERGPRRDVVLLNAGAALVAAGRAADLAAGVAQAAAVLDCGGRRPGCSSGSAPSGGRRTARRGSPRGDGGAGMTARPGPAARRPASPGAGVLAEIAARRAATSPPSSASATYAALARAAAAGARPATDRRAPGRARAPPDRRGQALVAVGRRDRSRRRPRRPGPRLRRGRRGRDLRLCEPHWFGVRGGPGGRARRRRRPGPGQAHR